MSTKLPNTMNFRPFEFTQVWLKDWHTKFEVVYERIAQVMNSQVALYNRTIYVPSTFVAGQEVFAEVVSDDMYFDVDFGKSQGRSGVPAASIVSVFSVQRNGSPIGTITHNVGVSQPVFATVSHAQYLMNRGDVLSIVAPTPVDGTLAQVSWVLSATRM